MDEVFGLFPTPFLRAPGTLSKPLAQSLVRHFSTLAASANKASGNLSHTEMLRPDDSPLLSEAATLITPKIVDIGALMFGQRLGWSIKEMWVNVLDTGGLQAPHTHANSFVSGVVYLTPVHPGSQTVFMKSSGGTEFLFKNEHADIAPTPFNGDRWVGPAPAPGDLVLFPSYVMHAVPPNQGAAAAPCKSDFIRTSGWVVDRADRRRTTVPRRSDSVWRCRHLLPSQAGVSERRRAPCPTPRGTP